MTDAEELAVLNKQTGITIGLAIVVVGASVTAAWWFGRWTGADSAWKRSTDQRLQKIENSIVTGTRDRWSSVDMVRWTSRLREANAGALVVPEPYLEER